MVQDQRHWYHMPETDAPAISEEVDRIRRILFPIFSANKVQKAILFGALARSTETRRSDVDLVIVMTTEKRFFDRYAQFERVHEMIQNRSVDMLIYTPSELESIAHRPFIKRILEEGVTIYES